ncbi:MAG: EAL domain-containing protein [Alphaproteobacteria bacterium]
MKEPDPSPGSDRLRLLVVDDGSESWQHLVSLARHAGVEVRTTSQADDFRALIGEFAPHAVAVAPASGDGSWFSNLDRSGDKPDLIMVGEADRDSIASARALAAVHGFDFVANWPTPVDPDHLRETLRTVDRRRVRLDLRSAQSALAAGDFVLYYQPVVATRDGRVAGYESLARLSHGDDGVLDPVAFLPALKRGRKIHALTDWAMKAAIVQAASWRSAGKDLIVSVNMSAQSLYRRGFPEEVGAELRRAGLPPRNLVLELTETEGIADARLPLDVLGRLRAQGIGLAIDDFGVGYSSLRELYRMPFTVMKIDRSFLADLNGGQSGGRFFRAIVELGRSLDLKIIAEGVEDPETFARVTAQGCDFAQGFHFGPPRPGAALA